MIRKTIQAFIIFICAASCLQASEQARYQQNPPSPLHASYASFALSSSSSTPLDSAQSPSPLCLPSPFFALDNLINQENISRDTLTNIRAHDFAALLATQKSEKSIAIQAVRAKKIAQKEMDRQQLLVSHRLKAVQDWKRLHPGCTPKETLLCPVTGDFFYANSGRVVINPNDLFKRP